MYYLNPLSVNPTKWSDTLKQVVGFADKLFECVCSFCGVGASLKELKVSLKNIRNCCNNINRHYSRAIWTSFYWFWTHVSWAPKLTFVYICAKEKSKFFVINHDKRSYQSRNFHFDALKTLEMLWFPELRQWNRSYQDCASGLYQGTHSFPYTRLALAFRSCAKGSPAKIIF